MNNISPKFKRLIALNAKTIKMDGLTRTELENKAEAATGRYIIIAKRLDTYKAARAEIKANIEQLSKNLRHANVSLIEKYFQDLAYYKKMIFNLRKQHDELFIYSLALKALLNNSDANNIYTIDRATALTLLKDLTEFIKSDEKTAVLNMNTLKL